MSNFWFRPLKDSPSLRFARLFFYAIFFLIFLSDYYGGFFVALSRTPPELRQPTWLEPLFGWFINDTSFYRATRNVFLAACVFAGLGFWPKINALIAAISGLYILNTLASFGQWHHPGGLPALALLTIFFVDWKNPTAWWFRLMQILVLWSYFSSGLYKVMAGGWSFDWVWANSLFTYVHAALEIQRVTDNRLVLEFLGKHETLCLYMGGMALTLELLCPIALLHRKLAYLVFTALTLFQFANHFVMNENFVLLLPILPALFWQAYAAEQNLSGSGHSRPA